MARYTWECKKCGFLEDHFVPSARRDEPMACTSCGSDTKRQFPVEAVRGIHTFQPHYNEGLGCDVHDASEHRDIMLALDVHEAGDKVGGARNFDSKAPHKVGKQPLRGERFVDRRTEKPNDPVVNIERKDGSVETIKFSELRSA